jgi:cyclohexanecarboxylate-CoA ligase
MLHHCEARILVVLETFHGFDYAAMARALQPQLPTLTRVVVVDGRGTGADDFDALLTTPAWEREADAADILTGHRPGPDDIAQLIYTSGTTGEPKGVMHSANTLLANILPYAQRMRLTGDDVILMASPMAHQTGFMYGLMMPIELQAPAVLLDVWNPACAARIIRDEKASFTMASTPFLADLTRQVRESGEGVPTLKAFLCAGAPIPGPLVEQARATLGSKIVSAWGMSENGAVTTTELDDDDTLAVNTDGHPLPGVEVKVTGVADEELPPGEPGRLMVRAGSNFGGYLKRPQWNATDAQGWFDTGDLAVMNSAGYIRISGRGKDVIIRGGENIPVFEVESLIYRHPAVAQVAIVAYPDARLGERACACVVCKAGQTLDLPELVRFLKEQKIALPYIPERLELFDVLPATPSGKIQKFRLREQLRQAGVT